MERRGGKRRDSEELQSRGIKRDQLKGTNGAKFAVFADFCRFSLSWELQHFGGAGNRRLSQKTTGNHRFSQKPVCPI